MKRTSILAAMTLAPILGCKSSPEATPTAASKPSVTETKPPVAATAGQPAPAPAAAKPPAVVASVEGMTEYRLDNGLRVLLFPDESQAKATVNIVYFVGSRHEGYGETGMAHLLEHMNFKGTPRHKEIWTELRDRGMAFNASTWYDRTNYYEIFSASDENLDFALDLEADRMVNSSISPEDLAKEFSVVRNEFENDENDSDRVLTERILATAYLWHNYGKSTIGSRVDIERVPAGALKKFYQRFYQPDNALLIVSGKIEKDKTLAMVAKHFGPIPRPTRTIDPTYTVEPVQDGERSVTLRRVGDAQYVGVAYHTVAGADERYVSLEALSYLMTDEPTGRLYKALVKTGMASHVSAFQIPLAEPGFIVFEAEVPIGKPIEPVREKLVDTIEGLGKNPATADEVKRFQARQRKAFELAFASPDGIALGLTAWAPVGDWRLFFLHRDRVEKLDAKVVSETATTFFKQANRTVGTFLPMKNPDRAPLPDKPDVQALLKEYKGREAVAAGEAFEATIDNIEKRTTRTAFGNGMKLALLPKSTRGQVVRAHLALHYGTEKDLVNHEEAASFIAPMLLRGSKKWSFEQVKGELDRLKATVQISGDDGNLLVQLQTTRPNLGEVIDLVTEILREPAFPADQFDVLKKRQLSEIQQQMSDPQALAQNALQRALQPYPKNDIRYVPTLQEGYDRVKAATLDDTRRLYRTLMGASFAQATFIGDFEPSELKASLEKGLGAWKSPGPYVRIAIPFQAVAGVEQKIDTPDKEGALLAIGANIEIRDDDPRYPALFMAGYVFGSSENSRLLNRLRQKEGWSYGAGGGVYADAIDKRGGLQGFALVAPQNAGKAMAAALEEIDKLVKGGVTAEELGSAKEAYARSFAARLTNDGTVLGLLNRALFLGRTLEFQKQVNEKISKLTPGDIAEALKMPAFQPGSLVRIVAADAKKAAAGEDKGGGQPVGSK